MLAKRVSEADREELSRLNESVTEAINVRKLWLDSKMPEYAVVQVGEEIYDINKNQLLGVVSKLYRYWQDRDEGVRDTSLSVNYEFSMPGYGNCFDNTSRMGYVTVGTRKDLATELKRKADALTI